VPMAFTWEIYGNMTADFHDCFRMFNPVSWVDQRSPQADELEDSWSRGKHHPATRALSTTMLCCQIARLTRSSLSHAQVDKVMLESVVNDWAGAVLRLVALMPGHPAVQRDLPGMCALSARSAIGRGVDPHVATMIPCICR